MTILTPVESQRNLIEDTLIDYPLPPTSTLFKSMAAGINENIKSSVPVGTIIESILSWAQFSQLLDASAWCVVDGQDISGSYLGLFGINSAPDTRGRFLRAKSLTSGHNPDGDLAVGSYTADKFKSHNHDALNLMEVGSGGTVALSSHTDPIVQGGSSVETTGDNETAPKTIHVYHYMRIN